MSAPMTRHPIRRGLLLIVVLTGALVLALSLTHARQDELDFNRARQLRQRFLQRDRLTDEEQAYLERAKAAVQKKQAGALKGARPVSKGSLGLTPLTDLAGESQYKGQDGGLYGGGKNQPPEKHLQAAIRVSSQIQPLNAEGKPSSNGKIVLISVGMSNTTQEFRTFMTLANRDEQKSPLVVLVDGAQGGMEASVWANPKRARQMGRPDPWSVLEQRLTGAGFSAGQVQVAWIKQARAIPASLGEFPRHAQELRDNMAVIVQNLKQTFPNLRIAYLSSRIYAGYAVMPLNPEPYAYESGFAVRWLIQDQIGGKKHLNYDPGQGEVRAPLLLWGPYLWADGVKGRKVDDLIWKREDLGGDGTHPSPSGQRKVAELLLHFFKTDATAKTWFVKQAPWWAVITSSPSDSAKRNNGNQHESRTSQSFF